jgi:uncharacterized membrane protein YphA (DoxX/SURF4 family)
VSSTTTANPTAPVLAPTRGGRGALLGTVSIPLRLGLGGLFLLAAYHKLFDENGPQNFSQSVRAFKVFDPAAQENLIQLATFVTPWIELTAGACVVLGVWTRGAAAVLGTLLLGFIGLISSALLRGLNLECGCFGKLSPFCSIKLGPCNLVQNGIMLAAALVILLVPRHPGLGSAVCRTPGDSRAG